MRRRLIIKNVVFKILQSVQRNKQKPRLTEILRMFRTKGIDYMSNKLDYIVEKLKNFYD